ncbi:MAG TPA: bacterial transcriptional activator domain-containing protein, partial [Longimicrobium sp.]|nr:bacterial transcriptional activator domain-containing protein [Longimicrobium sp.]
FEAGFGSDEFSAWADARRAELRRAAVRWLDRAGERAEREKDWPRAQRIGERSVQIDRVSEVGHRRVMRALLERGERNLALRHYREFAHWLIHEVGGLPDPETTALADVIRAGAPAIDPPPAPPAAEGDAMAETTRIPAGPEGPAKGDAAPPPPAAGWGTADSIRGGDVPQNVSTPGATPLESPPAAPAGIAPGPGGRRRGVRTAVVAPLLVAAIGAAVWLAGSRSAGEVDTHASFGRGEVIRAEGDATAYLSFGDTLYGFPDEATLKRCLGGWPRVRLVRALPPHPRRTLPSVRTQPWLGGEAAVRSEVPPATQYVVVGCVLSPIPDPPTFREIFGHGDWNRSRSPGDRLLRRLPSIELAYAFPLRPAGALIQGPGDSIRWVTYHGGALAVRDTTVLATYCRTRDEVVRVPDPEFRYYQGHADLPPASAPCGAAERRTLD